MLFLEPGIWKLDRDRLQNSVGYVPDQPFQPKHSVAKFVMQIREARLGRYPIRFIDQRLADLDTEMVPAWF